jgi:hypothetical protein
MVDLDSGNTGQRQKSWQEMKRESWWESGLVFRILAMSTDFVHDFIQPF